MIFLSAKCPPSPGLCAGKGGRYETTQPRTRIAAVGQKHSYSIRTMLLALLTLQQTVRISPLGKYNTVLLMQERAASQLKCLALLLVPPLLVAALR